MATTVPLVVEVAHRRRVRGGEYIGRPSTLSNPFVIGRDGTREEVIAQYAAWLDDALGEGGGAQDREFARLRAILLGTGRLTLVCWCAPLACHGDVIRARLLAGWEA